MSYRSFGRRSASPQIASRHDSVGDPILRVGFAAVLLVVGVVAPNIGFAVGARAAQQPPIEYSYDAAGRLTGVADTRTNQAAVYHYDRAGNIISIKRGPASILPSSNRHSVRGSHAAAPVVTGVTSGGTVITTADAGASVVVNGLNFDPSPSGDVVRVDGTLARVESAGKTQLTVVVPPTSGAGPVTVTTSAGTGGSAGNFFVPPGPYTAAQVGFTTTLVHGTPSTVDLAKAGRVALVAVRTHADPNADALAPKRMSVSLDNATLAAYNVCVYDPQNRLIYGPRGYGTGSNGFAFDLAESGIYTIVVDPGTSTGAVQVTARPFKDVIVPAVPSRSLGGKPAVISTTVPSQTALARFKGVAGELVSAAVSGSTRGGQSVGIETATGDVLTQTNLGGPTAFIDRATLPATGQYYLFSEASSWPGTGTFDVNLYRLTDQAAQLSQSATSPGSPATVTTALPGEDAHLRFSGRAGQDVSLLLSNAYNTPYTASLLAPHFTVLSSSGCGNGSCFLNRVTLPQTGSYRILLAHGGADTFKVAATLYRVTDIKKRIETSGALPGKSMRVNMTIPGQDADLTFRGIRGRFVSVAFASSTIGGFDATVIAPDGNALTNSGFGFGTGSGYIDRVDLPQTGTYRLVIQHRSYATGSVDVTVFEAGDVHKKIALSSTPAGRPQTVTLGTPGQNASLTFKGTAGEYISGTQANDTLGNAQLELLRPSGQALPGGYLSGNFLQRTQLPDTGTYRLVLLHSRNGTGSDTLTLYRLRDLHGTIKPNGPAVPFNLRLPGENAYLGFQGRAGHTVTVNLSSTTLPNCYVAIYAPDGAQLAEQGFGTSGSLKAPLTQNGQYTIAILHNQAVTGATQVSMTQSATGSSRRQRPKRLQVQPATAPYRVPGRDRPAAGHDIHGLHFRETTTQGTNASLSFNGKAGHDVSILLSTSSAGASYTAGLVAPDFSVLESTSCGSGICFLDRVTLPQSGRYRILLMPSGTATLSVSATVYRIKDIKESVKSSHAFPGNPVTVKTTAPGQDAYLTFHAVRGHFVSLALSNMTMNGLQAVLTAPDGDQLYSNGFGGAGFIDRVDVHQTGTYTLLLQHRGDSTGSVQVTVFQGVDIHKKITLSSTIAGSPLAVTLKIPGQNAAMTFKGSAGEYISAVVTNSTLGGVQMELVRPNGETMPGTGLSGSFFERTQLPDGGNYRLVLLHSQETTGSATITLYRLHDTVTTIKPNGPPVPVNLALPGDNSYLTFKGAPNHGVTLNVALGSLGGCGAAIYAPDGTLLVGTNCGFAGALENIALTQNGRYTVAILHDALRTGAAQASLSETAFGSVALDPPARPPARTMSHRVHTFRRHIGRVASHAYRKSLPTGTIIGSVRDDDGRPLSGATIGVGNRRTRTSRWGDFTLTRVEAGDQVLLVDGRTANQPGASYGLFPISVHVAADHVTALPYVIWMPRLDTKHDVTIASPTKRVVTLSTPRIPGLKIVLPAGAIVRDIHGRVIHHLGITPIPTSRPPFPFPSGHPFPVYFTIQPGGAVVTPARVRVIYPNIEHMPAGTRVPFWSYDPEYGGWWKYGYGTVTANGASIVPDTGVDFSSFTGAGAPSDKPPPDNGGGPCGCDCGGVPGGGGGGPPPGPGGSGYPGGGGGGVPGPGGMGAPGQSSCGDPVSMVSGLNVVQQTDLHVPDLIPINIERTYRPNDGWDRWFGVGQSFSYGLYVTPTLPWLKASLVLPDGQQIEYDRISAGQQQLDSEYEAVDSPGLFYASKLRRLGWDAWSGWRLTLTDGTSYEFTDLSWSGSNAVLTGVVDRNGNTTTLSWDTNSRNIRSVRSPAGYWATFSYNSAQNPVSISQIHDNAGRTVSYGYTGDQLTSVTDPRGETTTYAYGPNGDLTSIADARGNVFETNTYDNEGRVVQQKQADGGTFAFSYFSGCPYTNSRYGSETQVQYPNRSVRIMCLDPAGFPILDIFDAGFHHIDAEYRFVRTRSELLSSETDPLGRRTEYTYGASGNVTSVTRLAGTQQAQTYRYRWNQFAEPTSETDPLGHRTTYAYDSHGNLISVSDPLGRRWRYAYNPEGEATSVTDPMGHTWRYRYASGFLRSSTDPFGQTTVQVSDALGRVMSTTDPLGNKTTYRYDSDNNLRSSIDPLGDTTSMTYDPDNNLLNVADPRGGTTFYAYDTMDRVCAATHPLAHLHGPPAACPSVASFSHPTRVAVRTWLRHNSHTTAAAYDTSGNLVRALDRNGSLTTYAYDRLDRLTKVTYADGSREVISYDAGSRPIKIADSASGTITSTFDGLDRLTSQTQPVGKPTVSCSGLRVTVCYSYDQANNRSGMVVSGQQPVRYTYDAGNEITGETWGSGKASCNGHGMTVCISYDSDGRPASITLPDRIRQLYTYDAGGRLTGISYGRGLGSTKCGSASAASCLGSLSYGYDADGREISMGGPWARTNLPAAVGKASYNADNELTTWGSRHLTYDADGNLIRDGAKTYAWNVRHQLSGISGGSTAAFRYDALGRRISEILPGKTGAYLYDGLNPVQRLQSGTPTVNMLTGLRLDETFAIATGGSTDSLLTDGLGSTIAVAGASDHISAQYTYGPFGATTVAGPSPATTPAFTGMPYVNSTALYLDNARYYAPTQGRFISQDPLGIGAGTANMYQYALDNPNSYIDPLGLAPRPAPPPPGRNWSPSSIGPPPPGWSDPSPPSPPPPPIPSGCPVPKTDYPRRYVEYGAQDSNGGGVNPNHETFFVPGHGPGLQTLYEPPGGGPPIGYQ